MAFLLISVSMENFQSSIMYFVKQTKWTKLSSNQVEHLLITSAPLDLKGVWFTGIYCMAASSVYLWKINFYRTKWAVFSGSVFGVVLDSACHPDLCNNAVINAIDSPQVHCVLKIRCGASPIGLFFFLSAITVPQLHWTLGRSVVAFSGQTGSSLQVLGLNTTCILCCPNPLSDRATCICSCCLYWAVWI